MRTGSKLMNPKFEGTQSRSAQSSTKRFQHDLAKVFSEPSDEEIAFHEGRRKRGLGVGLNEHGELVYRRDINAKSNPKS